MNKLVLNQRFFYISLILILHLCLPGCAGPQSHRNKDLEAAAPAPVAATEAARTDSQVEDIAPSQEAPNDSVLLPESPQLELGYAELIREMGTPAEQQRLRDYLAGDTEDPAIRDFLISWYLATKDFDSARYLVAGAQSNQQPVPLWQRLALAVEDDNPEAVQQLINESDGELRPSTEVDALQRVGLDDQALALGQEYLDSIQTGPEAELLTTQVDALAMAHATFAEVGGEQQDLGDLRISSATVLLSTDHPFARITVEAAENKLDSSSQEVSVEQFDTEQDISLQATQIRSSRQLALKLGTNLRDDKSIVYGQFIWDERLSPTVSGRAELGINQLSIATSLLRAIGNKDLVALGATYNPNRWEYARAKLELHRYQTREDDQLGTGFLTEAALGRVVLQELPRWQVEFRGSWEKNNLENSVPAALIPAVLPPSTDIDTIVPSDFKTLGVATTLDYGSAGSGPLRRAKVLFDAWAGWLWPDDEAGYNVRVGLGTSVFSKDMLSLDAYYANALSGATNKPYKGVGITYRYHF